MQSASLLAFHARPLTQASAQLVSKATPSTLTSTVYATSAMTASVKSATTPTLPSAANAGRAPSAATPAARTVEMLRAQSSVRNAFVQQGAFYALHLRSAIIATTDFT